MCDDHVVETAQAIAAFWAWWPSVRPRLEVAIETGEYGDLGAEVTERVQAIDPGLAWELSAGRQAQHSLCVTPEGNATLRATSERWFLAAPPADATWEFAAARQPMPNALSHRFELGGREVDLARLVVAIAVDDDRQVVDVAVHHPDFAAMDDRAKGTVSFLALDWLLGEDGVERWVGVVNPADDTPPDAIPMSALPGVVEALEARHVEPTWAILQATNQAGQPVLVVARRPLKRIERPLFDLHGAIRLPFTEQQTPAGLPDALALDRLRAFEEALVVAVPEELAIVAAHVTQQGSRVLHLYCDAEGPARAAVEAYVGSSGVEATLAWDLDPAWGAIRPFQ